MIRSVILDAGPLGLITNPRTSPLSLVCQAWFANLGRFNIEICIPEIVDYEVRRELLRANRRRGLRNLDSLQTRTTYLPLTTRAMHLAAELWAQARQRGQPTAGDKTIDADMILAAQALASKRVDFVIATTNPRHLINFVPASLWEQITI